MDEVFYHNLVYCSMRDLSYKNKMALNLENTKCQKVVPKSKYNCLFINYKRASVKSVISKSFDIFK